MVSTPRKAKPNSIVGSRRTGTSVCVGVSMAVGLLLGRLQHLSGTWHVLLVVVVILVLICRGSLRWGVIANVVGWVLACAQTLQIRSAFDLVMPIGVCTLSLMLGIAAYLVRTRRHAITPT